MAMENFMKKYWYAFIAVGVVVAIAAGVQAIHPFHFSTRTAEAASSDTITFGLTGTNDSYLWASTSVTATTSSETVTGTEVNFTGVKYIAPSLSNLGKGTFKTDFRIGVQVCEYPGTNCGMGWTDWASDIAKQGFDLYSAPVVFVSSDPSHDRFNYVTISLQTRPLPAGTQFQAEIGDRLVEYDYVFPNTPWMEGANVSAPLDPYCGGTFTPVGGGTGPSVGAEKRLGTCRGTVISSDPDVIELTIDAYSLETFDASHVSDNIPPVFSVGETTTTGSDGKPLEIIMKNTGTSLWPMKKGVVTGTQSGTCQTDADGSGTNDAPSAIAGNGGVSCTTNFIYSTTVDLLSHSGSFAVTSSSAQATRVVPVTITYTAPTRVCYTEPGDCPTNGNSTLLNDKSPFFPTAYAMAACLGGTGPQRICEEDDGGYSYSYGASTSIEPGDEATFFLSSMTAPSSNGTYNETWQVEDNGDAFGSSFSIPITVGTPSTVTAVAVTCNPTAVGAQGTSACTATVTGTGGPSQAVTWTTSDGTIDASGNLTAPNKEETVTVTATSKQDNTKSGTATVTVGPPATVTSIAVTCNPASVSVNGASACTATVTGTGGPSQAVTWTTTGGTIDANGKITAPSIAGTVTVKATSKEDGTKSGTATITVIPQGPTITAVAVTCSPASTEAGVGSSACTANVTGTGSFDPSVTWSSSDGTIDASGNFTPANRAGTVTVTATSKEDTTKSGTANITVTANPGTISLSVEPSASGPVPFTVTITATISGASSQAPRKKNFVDALFGTAHAAAPGNTYLIWQSCTYGGTDPTAAKAQCGTPDGEADNVNTPAYATSTTYYAVGNFNLFVIAETPNGNVAASATIKATPATGAITVKSVDASNPSIPVAASWSLNGDVPGLDVCAATGVACSGTEETYTGVPAMDSLYMLSGATTNLSGYTSYTVMPADTQTLTETSTAATFLILWDSSSTTYYSCSGGGSSCAPDPTCTTPGSGCYAADPSCGNSCGGGSTYYSCDTGCGTTDPSCTSATSGCYPSAPICNAACGGAQHYSCSGAGNACAPSATGTYFNANCDNSCAGGPTYYSCSGTSCVKDPHGAYPSSNCDNSCAPSPTNYYSCAGGCGNVDPSCNSGTPGCYPSTAACNAQCGGGNTNYYSCATGCSVIDPTCTASTPGCYQSSGSCNSSCGSEVAPTISSFSATPGLVVVPEASNLTWSTKNASFCSIDPGGIPVQMNSDPANPENVYPTSTTVYVLTCSNPNGSATRTATTTVTVQGSGVKEGPP